MGPVIRPRPSGSGGPLGRTTTNGARVSYRFMPQVDPLALSARFDCADPRYPGNMREIATVRPARKAIRPSNRANSGMRSLVSSVPRHRRKRKIRRTGQHTTPSQVEKVAQTAGKAAPAVVVVGTLATAAPHIGGVAAASPAATAPHVIHAHLDAAALPAGQAHATQAAPAQAAATEAASARAARTQAAAGRQLRRADRGHAVRHHPALLRQRRQLAVAVRGQRVEDQQPEPDLRG